MRKAIRMRGAVEKMLRNNGSCEGVSCEDCPIDLALIDFLDHSSLVGVPGISPDTDNPIYAEAKIKWLRDWWDKNSKDSV